jgi:hypothetical protein
LKRQTLHLTPRPRLSLQSYTQPDPVLPDSIFCYFTDSSRLCKVSVGGQDFLPDSNLFLYFVCTFLIEKLTVAIGFYLERWFCPPFRSDVCRPCFLNGGILEFSCPPHSESLGSHQGCAGCVACPSQTFCSHGSPTITSFPDLEAVLSDAVNYVRISSVFSLTHTCTSNNSFILIPRWNSMEPHLATTSA